MNLFDVGTVTAVVVVLEEEVVGKLMCVEVSCLRGDISTVLTVVLAEEF